MTTTAALIFAALLAGLAVLQVVVAAGAPLGRFVWGGQHEVLPRNLRIGSVVAIGLYVVFIAVIWNRAGLVDVLPKSISSIAAWVITGFFVLGTIANGISRSLPERYTMTPLNIALLACCLVVVLGQG